ncbi:MAG: hypothetical protein J4N95_02730 [Chloroflexi bacterium]|nr:hypothetical protein [Chloroflexota bacterium]
MIGNRFILFGGVEALRMLAMACGNALPDDLHAARYDGDVSHMMGLPGV